MIIAGSTRRLLLCTTGVLWSGAAFAQAAGPVANDSDIVVTATRQSQVLSKVPISVSAYTQKSLDVQGIRDIDDVTRFTPGITLERNGFGTQADISIRGIDSDIGAGTVGVYVDDTPIQTRPIGYSSTNLYPQLFDLERVEVLRGPQGTLFGAGSEGGTIRFITPTPSLTEWHGYGRAEVGAIDGGGAANYLAAWGVAERERQIKDSAYRGAVAVAGATHLAWLLDHPEATKGAGFYLAWHAYAVHTRYPQFRVVDMLSPAGQAHYREVTAKGCWYYGYAAYHGVEAPDMVNSGWKTNIWVRRFVAENSAGGAPIRGPILVIAGDADGSVPIGGVRDTVRKACARGTAVDFRIYPGLDHDPTMIQSTPAQLAWIRDRFAGKPAPGDCRAGPPRPELGRGT